MSSATLLSPCNPAVCTLCIQKLQCLFPGQAMTQMFAKMYLDKAPQRSLDQCLEIGQFLLFRNFGFRNENNSIIVKTKKHYETQCMKTLPQAQSSTTSHIKDRLNPHLELHLHHLNRIRDFNLEKPDPLSSIRYILKKNIITTNITTSEPTTMNSSNEITLTASEPTTMTSTNGFAITTSDPTTTDTSTTTTTAKASATSYSYRPRNDIKTPSAFPVAFSPLRNRSTKRTNRGYKDTATVKMPVKVKSDNVSKSWSPATKMTAEQKAGLRAVRLEARRLAKGMQGCEAVGEEVVAEDGDGEVGEV